MLEPAERRHQESMTKGSEKDGIISFASSTVSAWLNPL